MHVRQVAMHLQVKPTALSHRVMTMIWQWRAIQVGHRLCSTGGLGAESPTPETDDLASRFSSQRAICEYLQKTMITVSSELMSNEHILATAYVKPSRRGN